MTQTACFCNVQAIEKGLDPGGSAGHFEDAVIIEQPLPWKYSYADINLPSQVHKLLALWLQRYRETGVYGHRPLLIAPDEEYSQDGHRRVMFYTRPQGEFATFERTEYLVPEERLGALVWAWFEAPDALPQYDTFRCHENNHFRDILVCTHGSIDVACAKFGYSLYRHLRDHAATDSVRVWRVSHFGGHLYAPTMMDMPKGDYWAYVDAPIGEQIVNRAGDISALSGHYRGWAGVAQGFMQAAERACLLREGWSWQYYAKSGEITASDDADEPQWAEVRLSYTTPDGAAGAYRVRVEIENSIITSPASNDTRERAYPQFVVTSLEQTG